ncbi:MAG TPA: class I SAM-dependent methyltransferase [Gemmatimonadales bacterium]|nr:class I SAM-dependent methyltransferase [Gemmatimonadales bacterium]
MLGVYSDSSDATEVARPSSWFVWHAQRIRSGSRVLDLACGTGRHALAAAALGAQVTAVDRDPARLEVGRNEAKVRGIEVDWRELDLEAEWPDLGIFDAVLVFNYLDRERMSQIVDRVGPGGLLFYETFLKDQIDFGWGPTDPAHLLESGELNRLVTPLVVLHGREVIEPMDNARWIALASVLAQRK